MSDTRVQRQPNKNKAPFASFLPAIATAIFLVLLALSGIPAFGLDSTALDASAQPRFLWSGTVTDANACDQYVAFRGTLDLDRDSQVEFISAPRRPCQSCCIFRVNPLPLRSGSYPWSASLPRSSSRSETKLN